MAEQTLTERRPVKTERPTLSLRMRIARALLMVPLIPFIAIGARAETVFDWLDGKLDDR